MPSEENEAKETARGVRSQACEESFEEPSLPADEHPIENRLYHHHAELPAGEPESVGQKARENKPKKGM